MPEYENLAVLRRALTSDDADRRADAYGHVLGADVSPADVLDDPTDETVQTLADADVIGEAPSDEPPITERLDRIIELLDTIASNTGGS